MIKKIIVGSENPTEKELFMWNMIGSAIYALTSLILTYMTIRVIGEKEGGVFAIALTLAQMFINIAYYEMRNYQVTDHQNKYKFAEYHGVKIINCFLMMIVSGLYVYVKGYTCYKAWIIILTCVYRMLDGYADVYEAEFHAKGRLDLAGKSMAFRTVFSVGVYFILLVSSGNLIYALLGAIAAGLVGIYIFNILVFDAVGKIQISLKKISTEGIFKDCFPLFLGMFLWTYLLSASRIAVDNVLTSEYQSYYQVLFMPVSVINLLAGFLIRPNLIKLTELNAEGKQKEFWEKIGEMGVVLSMFTVCCMIGAYLIGTQILSIIVNSDLQEYRTMFVFLIFAGGFNALAYLLYFVLTIFRNQKDIVLGYGVASFIAVVISTKMVEWKGLWGASFSYLITICVLIVIFVGCIWYRGKKQRIRGRK